MYRYSCECFYCLYIQIIAGNDALTEDQEKTQMAIWSIFAAVSCNSCQWKVIRPESKVYCTWCSAVRSVMRDVVKCPFTVH